MTEQGRSRLRVWALEQTLVEAEQFFATHLR